jgi:hypothetical protein
MKLIVKSALVNLSDTFPIENDLKKMTGYMASDIQVCFRIFHQEGPRKSRTLGTEWSISFLDHAVDVVILNENTKYHKERSRKSVRG